MKELRQQSDLKDILLSDDVETRNQFVKIFAVEIDSFTATLFSTYERLKQMSQKVPGDQRSAWVHAYLFNAINNLLNSFRLQILGMFVPAGNLMRHFGESIAMALLLSNNQVDVFERFIKDPDFFPVQKAIDMKPKRKSVLGINHTGWEQFREITSFFDQYSHASVLALANSNNFSEPGTLFVGSGFDPEKEVAYRKEINLLISACSSLLDTIEKAEEHLTEN